MTDEGFRKPLLCRLHLHSCYPDSGMYIRNVARCQRCNQYPDADRGAQLDLERELRGEARDVLDNPDGDEIERYVRAFLFGYFIEDYPPRPTATQHELDLRCFRVEEAMDREKRDRRRKLGEQARRSLTGES